MRGIWTITRNLPHRPAAFPGSFESEFEIGCRLHHQNSTPNCSRLGVSICTSRTSRRVRAHSACARGASALSRRAAGSTLFCPLFSQNLHQLFRSGTRTSLSGRTACACVGFTGFLLALIAKKGNNSKDSEKLIKAHCRSILEAVC